MSALTIFFHFEKIQLQRLTNPSLAELLEKRFAVRI